MWPCFDSLRLASSAHTRLGSRSDDDEDLGSDCYLVPAMSLDVILFSAYHGKSIV